MSRHRVGNVVLEPLPETVISAEEARDHIKVLEALVTRPAFERKASVTVQCWRNEFMSREYARELFRLITVDLGVPKARFISPTLESAAHLFDAVEDSEREGTVTVYPLDQGRTGTECKTLADYAKVLGY